MEGRRMTTRSSRRATPLPVSPIKQAVMANVMNAGKAAAAAKRSTRKVLADKTNATPVAAGVPSKSPKKAAVSTPSRKRVIPVEKLPGTPVGKGEELLRSLVHSNLSIIQTPNGPASQTPEAETPQFGVPYQPSPAKSEVDGNDSDCSVVVNVSSPGLASPAPALVPPTTPQTADFKWQRRDSLKVKNAEAGECAFNYYEDECEDYDEYDGEDQFGQVVDCDDICQGISRIQVADQGLPEHKGRHLRFNYNSDDELDVEEVDVMRLRGLPTPMGTHLRFTEDKNE